jgi:hypothetical protein
MDFVALILFLTLYYLRPQEWFTEFNKFHPVQLLSVLAIWGLAKGQKLNFRSLVQTPLDWLMVIYFCWTLVAGFEPRQTFSGIQSVMLFYFVGVCSLDSIPRQKKFLGWWCVFIFIISFLAVASRYGFDPLGGRYITEGAMKGRLILNLTVFNNPNALAHSVISVVPLFYYLVYWRRTVAKAGLLLLAVPLYCIYLTQSKGAFISGFATILATLTFGRSKAAQILILVLAIGFGYGALYKLPRMSELNHAQSDPAIEGRIAALTFGLSLMRANFFGIGLGNFQRVFYERGPLEKVRVPRMMHFGTLGVRRRFVFIAVHYSKATHCAYNQNGAELGYIGLFLFVGILYCCVRTLLLVKSQDDDEERIRRALFALVVAYAVSSWMVDFCYRPTFFLMVAAVSAFHRHLLRKEALAGEPVEEKPVVAGRPWIRHLPPVNIPGIPLPGLAAPVPAGSAACMTATMEPPPFASTGLPPLPAPEFGVAGSGPVPAAGWKPRGSFGEALRKKFIWNKLGIFDFLIMLALTDGAIHYWEHLIATM